MADGELFIAHSASAEICCFIALGWPLPTRVLDTMVEAARLWNGKMASQLGDKESVLEPSLLKALAYFGIPCRGTGEKDAAIDLVLRGGPYTSAEIDNTLAYSWTMRRTPPVWPRRLHARAHAGLHQLR